MGGNDGGGGDGGAGHDRPVFVGMVQSSYSCAATVLQYICAMRDPG